MKKLLSIVTLAILVSTGAQANSAAAKAALSQSTTNSFCSAGSNEYNPFDKAAYIQSTQFKGKCQAGQSYVQCLKESWQRQNQ